MDQGYSSVVRVGVGAFLTLLALAFACGAVLYNRERDGDLSQSVLLLRWLFRTDIGTRLAFGLGAALCGVVGIANLLGW